ETTPLTHILISTGSELSLAIEAAKQLGGGVRVVSMPSFARFDAQSDDYRESILPSSCRKRVSAEAGVSPPWRKYVGLDGKIVGVDRFGLSAPAPAAFKALGLTVDAIVAAAKSL
ncbi:MAG: transketolase, partial [Verrucomicrobiota bacterium]|nr:transketolase [Verrucomicrobiota bacterium]